ncbi:MAG: IS1 family transposase, partial [Cyanobacteria bacterium RI_101]|nr:IS1 family transposase [Cyanobacteria bacterium RI_101]
MCIPLSCPHCHSQKIVKNGSIHNGKKKYRCKNCGRQFIENPTKKYIDDQT